MLKSSGQDMDLCLWMDNLNKHPPKTDKQLKQLWGSMTDGNIWELDRYMNRVIHFERESNVLTGWTANQCFNEENALWSQMACTWTLAFLHNRFFGFREYAWAEGMAHLVEHLPSNHKVLSSKPSANLPLQIENVFALSIPNSHYKTEILTNYDCYKN